MRHLLLSLALLAGVSTASAAQNARSTVLVYPFGMTAAARQIGPDAAGVLAARAVEGVRGTNRLAAINESANAAIRTQVDAATTLSQFESAVQLKTDRQLQSKYLLTGFVQGAEVKLEEGRANERVYSATITALVQIYDVETREVIGTKELTMRNGLISGAKARDCSGWKARVKCAAEDAAGKTGDDLINKAAGGSVGQAIKADSPQAAVDAALRSASSEITKLLNEVIK